MRLSPQSGGARTLHPDAPHPPLGTRWVRLSIALSALALSACSSSSSTVASVTHDAGDHADTGSKADSGSSKGHDSGTVTHADASADVGTGADASTGADSGSPDAATCGPSMTYGGGEATIHEGTLTAKLVDENGDPVAAGQPLYICGINICADPGMTTSTGAVSLMTNLSMKKPAFKFGDAITYAEFGIPLSTSSTDFTTMGTGILATAKLSDKPGAALTAGTAATSGDVTITIPAGDDVEVNQLVYTTADMQMFHAVSVPLTNAALILPTTPTGFALLYGVAPAETTFCPAAQVTVAIPSSLGWTAGAAVEFWITTTDTGQTYAPYAGWALMSDGVVSTDGKSVTTTASQGFLLLENFAVRLKD